MIDTKKIDELRYERAELDRKFKVYREIADFILENVEKCKNEGDYAMARTWLDIGDSHAAKLKLVSEEYDVLIHKFKEVLD